MAVITISRQLGSAGDYIANLVSSMLSYRLVTKESMVRELTKRNVMDAETAREIGEGKPGIFDRFMKNKSKSIYAIRDLIHEAANEDDSVILGRGANLELKEHPSLLRIRVIANLEVRIRRIIRDKGLEKSQVTKLIKQSDKQHQEYVKHFFLMDIDDPDLYDLVINTTKISPDTAARLIVQAARQFTITSRTSTNG